MKRLIIEKDFYSVCYGDDENKNKSSWNGHRFAPDKTFEEAEQHINTLLYEYNERHIYWIEHTRIVEVRTTFKKRYN